jgi:chromosome segregation ATPase
MKKNKLYTLLCTTILISGVALGAEDQERLVPQTPVSKLRTQITAIPKTPSQGEQEKRYLASNSPYTAKYLAKRDIAEFKLEHATQRATLMEQLAEEEYSKQRENLKKAEAERLVVLLEEQRQAKLAEEERDASIQEMNQRITSIMEELKQNKSEMEAMEKELAEAKAATEMQRTQRRDIMEKADEAETRLMETLQKKEEKYRKLTEEHYEVKIKLDELMFEKETRESLKGIVDSKDVLKKQVKPSPEKKLDPSISTVVSTPQPQSNIVDNRSGDGSSVTETKKRVVKKQGGSDF